MDDSITESLKHSLEALEARLLSLEEKLNALGALVLSGPKPKPARRADIPQIEAVYAYAETLPLPPEEALHFFDHFTANGWKVGGKAPMKDWQAALRNWHRNWERYKKPKLVDKPKQPALGDDEFWTPPQP